MKFSQENFSNIDDFLNNRFNTSQTTPVNLPIIHTYYWNIEIFIGSRWKTVLSFDTLCISNISEMYPYLVNSEHYVSCSIENAFIDLNIAPHNDF